MSGEELSGSRVEALQMLGIPENNWTHVKHSKIKRNKGVYFGNHGSGSLVIASRVDSDSMTDIDEALVAQEKALK